MSKRLLIAFVIVDVLLGFAVYCGYQSWSQRDTFREAAEAQQAANAEMRELGATEFPEPRDLVGFTLQDQNAEPFSNQHLRGKWSLVFFGFTHCPDICKIKTPSLLATSISGASGA
jgi:protein SCO1/2